MILAAISVLVVVFGLGLLTGLWIAWRAVLRRERHGRRKMIRAAAVSAIEKMLQGKSSR